MTQQTSSPVPSGTDPRPVFQGAAAQVVRLLRGLVPADLGRATPCPEYDVRALAGHLITVLRRPAVVATGGEALSVPSVSPVADDDLAATASAAGERLAEVWSDDDVLDRVFVLPFGTMPGRGAASAFTVELTTHAWDLATALGRADTLDDTLAEVALDLARRFIPAEHREGPVPFGPVVDVAEDAAPYARLAAWLGRDPRWASAGS